MWVCHQLLVCALLNHPAPRHHNNGVRVAHSAQPVGDHHHRPAAAAAGAAGPVCYIAWGAICTAAGEPGACQVLEGQTDGCLAG